ncbi:MAG: hypothetical protein EP330_14965 [Deltaproteobacteria bacterium]|nr:MAG: hypothetical protein EP330_14965 [Deltaproteobacteria bacterium]
MLPDRTREAEDAFVAVWTETEDTEGLLEVIDVAMAERRPMLAARLVGLLDGRVEIPPGSAAEHAQRAARFLLHTAKQVRGEWSVEEGAFEDLEAAWSDVRADRMRRIRARQRDALEGKRTRIPRVARRKGKRE